MTVYSVYKEYLSYSRSKEFIILRTFTDYKKAVEFRDEKVQERMLEKDPFSAPSDYDIKSSELITDKFTEFALGANNDS